MSFNPKYVITIEIAKFLVTIEEQKNVFETKPLTPKLLSSLRKSARLETTHYSTQIEGNMMTLAEVEKVVIEKKGFVGRERDRKEVEHYYKALEFIENLKNEKLTELLIQKIHNLVMNGKAIKSKYREGQNVIRNSSDGSIVYLPPEAKDVPDLMKEMIGWLNQALDKGLIPVPVLAAIIHYQIATIHPYYDGNGRTARLVTTFLLHRYAYGLKGIYSLEEYYAKNLDAYYNALAVENIPNYYMGRAEADITNFITYFIKSMSIAFSKVSALAKAQAPTKTINTAELRALNAQQRNILSLFEKFKEVSNKEVANHLGIKTRSASLLIKKWLQSGFLEIENPSNKARTYKLNSFCEDYIS